MTFKVGDRVVFFDEDIYTEVITPRFAVIDFIDHNAEYPFYITYDDTATEDRIKEGPWLILESVYHSPLYRALS